MFSARLTRMFILFTIIGLFITMPTTSYSIEIGIWPPGVKLTCSISYNSTSGWTFKVDPINTEQFQLDVAFDPTRAQFTGIEYISPYMQTTTPDLSQLGDGLLQDVAGISSISPPPPGDVDIFAVAFADLQPGLPPELAVFTAFASSNDFVVGLDTDTGTRITYGPDDIQGVSCAVPEPTTMLLLGSGLLGLAGFTKKKRKKS